MIEALQAALEDIARRDDVRVVVVRGAGAAFCAGLDLRELAQQREAGEVETRRFERALETLERCPQPTIAAVHGDAIAGGCELALHCDLKVTAESARLTMPLARIGLAVPVALTWKPGGTSVAAADLERTVAALARQIARNAPLSIRAMKAFVQRATEAQGAWRRDDLEEFFRQVRSSADAREGLAAQRERRAPTFRGK